MGRNDLIPLNKRTKEERKRICSNGGKKSGEARRKQRTMRNIFRMVKGLRINDAEIRANLRELGIKEKDMTYGVLFAVSVFNNAMKGNLSTNSFFRKYPKMYVSTYQGALNSTSEGVKAIFKKARKILEVSENKKKISSI